MRNFRCTVATDFISIIFGLSIGFGLYFSFLGMIDGVL